MYKFLSLTVLLLLIITACKSDDDGNSIEQFKVEFEKTIIESFLDTSTSTSFKITLGGTIATGSYQLKYRNTKGSGYYYVDSEKIEEDEFVDLVIEPKNTIEYVATTIGVNNVTITIQDKEGREQDFSLVYNVNDTAFSFSIEPDQITIYEGERLDLNFSISEISNANYDISYVVDNSNTTGLGNFIVDGDVFLPEEVKTLVDSNEVIFNFEGVSGGDVTVLFTITSSLGVVLEKSLTIEVLEIPDFSFTSQLSITDEVEVNTATVINFELIETVGTSEYIMTYVTSSQGSLEYNDKVYQSGDEIIIVPGASTGQYTGALKGDHDLEFTVINANNIPIKKTTSITLTFVDTPILPEVIAWPNVISKDVPGILIGENLNLTTKIVVEGIEAVIIEKELNSVEFLFPSSLPTGLYTVLVYNGDSIGSSKEGVAYIDGEYVEFFDFDEYSTEYVRNIDAESINTIDDISEQPTIQGVPFGNTFLNLKYNDLTLNSRAYLYVYETTIFPGSNNQDQLSNLLDPDKFNNNPVLHFWMRTRSGENPRFKIYYGSSDRREFSIRETNNEWVLVAVKLKDFIIGGDIEELHFRFSPGSDIGPSLIKSVDYDWFIVTDKVLTEFGAIDYTDDWRDQ
ncbi:hypothetical protein [Aquimarina addita]